MSEADKSNLSEEKIIKYAEYMIKHLDFNKIGYVYGTEVVQGLLDLYNKASAELLKEKEISFNAVTSNLKLKEELNKEKEKNKEYLYYQCKRCSNNKICKQNSWCVTMDRIPFICDNFENINYISKDKIRELREIDNIDLIQTKLKELLEEE